jgi:hypothetical protein
MRLLFIISVLLLYINNVIVILIAVYLYIYIYFFIFFFATMLQIEWLKIVEDK